MPNTNLYTRSTLLRNFSKLSSYSWSSVLFRLVAVSAVSISMLYIGVNVSTDVREFQDEIDWTIYLRVVIVFNLLTEGNVLLEHIFERFYPVPKKIELRVFGQIIFSSVFAFFTLRYFAEAFHQSMLINKPLVQLMLSFGLFFVFIVILISISMRVSNLWVATQHEVEGLKRAKLRSDYNALQDQLNPHFLFNNLSVLKSMIKYDPDGALKFTQNFTDVYRYVLQSKDADLVPLDREVEFIKAFLDLHKERLGEGMIYTIDWEEELNSKGILPLALQLLVENAIKHNICSKEKPLHIRIYREEERLVVENNIQLRETTYSTKAGLKNLQKRFEFVSKEGVDIHDDGKVFRVSFPLLEFEKEKKV